MAARKVQDEGEAIRWFGEGKSLQWMVDEYARKYNIETTRAMWGNFRRRRGLDRRWTRGVDLIPWSIEPEHRDHYDLAILRFEARRREGLRPLTSIQERKLTSRLARLEERGAVIHYDPDTQAGFLEVPRRVGTDGDMIREPDASCRYLRRELSPSTTRSPRPPQ